MKTKFSFWAYGILAIAAFSILMYATSSIAGYPEVGIPLLGMAQLIVLAFVVYMFTKLILKRY